MICSGALHLCAAGIKLTDYDFLCFAHSANLIVLGLSSLEYIQVGSETTESAKGATSEYVAITEDGSYIKGGDKRQWILRVTGNDGKIIRTWRVEKMQSPSIPQAVRTSPQTTISAAPPMAHNANQDLQVQVKQPSKHSLNSVRCNRRFSTYCTQTAFNIQPSVSKDSLTPNDGVVCISARHI